MKNRNVLFFALGSLLVLLFLNIFLLKLYDHYIYQSLNRLVVSLENVYPDTEIELVKALGSIEDIEDVLGKYGISKDTIKEILPYHNFRLFIVLLVSGAFVLIILLLFCIYFLRNKKIQKEIELINEYLKDILNDHYELNIAQYNEDELSILKNDIYKVTIKLKNLSSYEKQEQQFLMNTLEDISHQLKTPLTALMITNDILVNNDLSEEERDKFLQRETRELERMEWLITTLLKLSKLDSGTVKFKKEKIRVDKLVDEALSSLLIPLELKEVVVVKKHLDFNLFCDIAWMREALTNILKNAFEHVGLNGNITIVGEDNPVYRSISITDDGVGIEKSEIQNIFKRFYSNNSSKNSLGIGLNMANIIIEKHNGKIEVDSVLGKYTTFKIIFMKRNC